MLGSTQKGVSCSGSLDPNTVPANDAASQTNIVQDMAEGGPSVPETQVLPLLAHPPKTLHGTHTLPPPQWQHRVGTWTWI